MILPPPHNATLRVSRWGATACATPSRRLRYPIPLHWCPDGVRCAEPPPVALGDRRSDDDAAQVRRHRRMPTAVARRGIIREFRSLYALRHLCCPTRRLEQTGSKDPSFARWQAPSADHPECHGHATSATASSVLLHRPASQPANPGRRRTHSSSPRNDPGRTTQRVHRSTS